MSSARLFLKAAMALAALSLPAFAGEPGPYLKAYTPPVAKPAPAPQTTYNYSDDAATRQLNQQAYHSIRPLPAPKYTYTRTAPAAPCGYTTTVNTGCGYSYRAPTTTYTTTTTRRYVAPPTTRTVTTGGCYTQTVCPSPAPPVAPAPVAPAPVYHPHPPQPVYPPAPQHWIAFQDCGKNTIRRLPDGRDDEKRYEVCYSDLRRLTDYDRDVVLLDRIETAARRACDDASFSFSSRRSERKCRSESTEEAVLSTGLPTLIDYYFVKQGKRRPNVKVGPPIYY